MDKRFKAFLDLIAFSEGTSTSPVTKNNGYDVIVTGVNGPAVFSDYADHPFAHRGSVVVRMLPILISTAAGRYQLLARYWNVYRSQLHLANFGPDSQDTVALQQMKERNAFQPLLMDNVTEAIALCSNIWASFPGNSYGQHAHSMPMLVAKYKELLGGS